MTNPLSPSRPETLRALIGKWKQDAAKLNFFATHDDDCDDEDRERAFGEADARVKCAAELESLLAGLQAPSGSQPPCVVCGAVESKDGDWYRVCGVCRWMLEVIPASSSASTEQK